MNVVNALINHIWRLDKEIDRLNELLSKENANQAQTTQNAVIDSIESLLLRNEVLVFDLEYDKFVVNSTSFEVLKTEFIAEINKLNRVLKRELDSYKKSSGSGYLSNLVAALEYSRGKLRALSKQLIS